MSLEFHNGAWRRGCPGCGAHGAPCKWVNGALCVSCTECDSEFQYLSKSRPLGRGGWIRRLADPIQHAAEGVDNDAS